MLSLHNTLTKQKEKVKPIHPNEIRMYNCGPTVYWDVHTGNLRTYVAWDILARYLRWRGIKVKRLINFTDVGHMTTDDNFGEDKIEKKAKEENLEPLDIANKYITQILKDFRKMNIQHPDGSTIDDINIETVKSRSKKDWAKLGWARATDYIPEMINIVKKIEKNGFTYETDQAVYFDVTKYKDYTKLTGQDLTEKQEAVRDDVKIDPQKKHPADFVLWMKKTGKYKNHIMYWDSPWGAGFPGWHIECSAMAAKKLGERFDIHTGGVDHIGVHHTNERAQNYGAFGQDGANFWVHGEMVVDSSGKKASKSKKNVFFLSELTTERGYHPMDLRYYFLTVNYSKPIAFSLEGLRSAKHSRKNLIKKLYNLQNNSDQQIGDGEVIQEVKKQFQKKMDDNLNTAATLALINDLLSSDNKPNDILATIYDLDQVLGLNLIRSVSEYKEFFNKKRNEIDTDLVNKLVKERTKARNNKNFSHADEIRDKLDEMGVILEDTDDGTVWQVK